MNSESTHNVGLDPTDENLEVTVERTPTVLILDTSWSMRSESTTAKGETKKDIDQLNEGLEMFKGEVLEKEHAATRVDVGLVEFGGQNATVKEDFTNIESFNPPTLSASGQTPMGDAIEKAIDMAEEVKTFYGDEGISYTRPLLWLLTDGAPTDMNEGDAMWDQVQRQLEVGAENDHFVFFAMGIGDADMKTLENLVEPTNRPALKIKEGMFKEYFEFLSNSLEDASAEEGTLEQAGDPEKLKQFTQIG